MVDEGAVYTVFQFRGFNEVKIIESNGLALLRFMFEVDVLTNTADIYFGPSVRVSYRSARVCWW
jgi:hypothetical protein